MFEQTWSWAGKYRTTNKNISPHAWPDVPQLVRDLLANTRAQYDAVTQTPCELDAVATKFHHQLALVHPWPNGNGRHVRLATDRLLRRWGRPAFSWGAASSREDHHDVHQEYLRALRAADAGNLEPLMNFVRS